MVDEYSATITTSSPTTITTNGEPKTTVTMMLNADSSDKNRKARSENVAAGAMGLFKFADETQMGGLNSLMNDFEMKQNSGGDGSGGNNNIDDFVNIEDGHRLQAALGETTAFMSKTISDHRRSPTSHCNGEFGSVLVSSTAKRKNPLIGSATVDDGKKSARACKGKRYIEFMQSNRANMLMGSANCGSSPPKRSKPKTGTTSYQTLSPSMDFQIFDHLYASGSVKLVERPETMTTTSSTTAAMPPCSNSIDPTDLKSFDASDFDLEDKIQALSALNLDKYLSRKRNPKNRKKINAKRSMAPATMTVAKATTNSKPTTTIMAAQTFQEAKEQIRQAMVGSQKRKARKESITRRDIQNDVPLLTSAGSTSSSSASVMTATAAPSPTDSSNLFILATIAIGGNAVE